MAAPLRTGRALASREAARERRKRIPCIPSEGASVPALPSSSGPRCPPCSQASHLTRLAIDPLPLSPFGARALVLARLLAAVLTEKERLLRSALRAVGLRPGRSVARSALRASSTCSTRAKKPAPSPTSGARFIACRVRRRAFRPAPLLARQGGLQANAFAETAQTLLVARPRRLPVAALIGGGNALARFAQFVGREEPLVGLTIALAAAPMAAQRETAIASISPRPEGGLTAATRPRKLATPARDKPRRKRWATRGLARTTAGRSARSKGLMASPVAAAVATLRELSAPAP